MEISRVNRNTPVSTDKKAVASKNEFSQSFNFARERRNEEQLQQMLEEIKKKGNRLVVTKCYADVRAYKSSIRDYLKSVMEYMYGIKKDISFWQTQYFITVETIDNKLEELTNSILKQEKENLNIASTIDEIAGLIVDIYK